MSQSQDSRPRQEIGLAVPEFSLPVIGGGSIRSLASFRKSNKGVVVVFWSAACAHCVRYDGYLNSFRDRHPELALVLIASRQGETAKQIVEAMRHRGLTVPILHDPDGAVAAQWYAHQTPRAFLVSPEGILRYRGAIDNFRLPEDEDYVAYLEPAVHAFLSGLPIERAETASFGCPVQSVYYTLPKQL